ncbi:hypothetical protein PDJAM_G00133940 [Pangasius djambal]|uniref:Uncharacterized protein n=1 Tax=Pangasius djambal TaxID=1691987 RepID=A0ACC5ZDM5_9TELE|nr:hypothetical protein [Pangasius djambal]
MPVNLQCMSLDWGGDRSTQRKPPKHGENMQTPHTQGGSGIQTPSPVGDIHAPMLSLSSENTQCHGFGRHFLFDPGWENGIYSNTHQHSKDEDLFFKHATLLPPVSNPTCSVNRKESPFTVTKSCTLVSEDGCRLNAVSITTAPISACSISKNRRIKSRVCNPSTLKFTTTDQSYADPVLGASASFIQRLLEMSTMQEKTVRQEKIKELKKNRRHEP